MNLIYDFLKIKKGENFLHIQMKIFTQNITKTWERYIPNNKYELIFFFKFTKFLKIS